MKRDAIAQLIVEKITDNKDLISAMYKKSSSGIGYFYIDSLLPESLVSRIYNAFPKPSEMTLKRSLREYKYVSAQMNLHNPILEEIIYAFQDHRVVSLISEICDCKNILPDNKLYAGGISMMGKEHFLNPHLDNSHDKERNLWRVFNLLYYVSPDWLLENGGNLELWSNGLNQSPVVVESKCNRLVLMATHSKSIHSVSKVTIDAIRCCVSNYYFSENSLLTSDTFHVTSFRGRPGLKFTDALLKMDTFLRMNLRKFFRNGIKENPHYYKDK